MNLTDLRLDPKATLEVVAWPDRLGGMVAQHTRGWLVDVSKWDAQLYRQVIDRATVAREIDLAAIPYFAWANREAGSIRVWLPKFEA